MTVNRVHKSQQAVARYAVYHKKAEFEPVLSYATVNHKKAETELDSMFKI